MTSGMTVLYGGHVQGVGFRFVVCDLASRRPVAGWVRNESDGTVRLVAEGEETELRSLLEAIRTSRVGRFITSEHVEWTRVTEGLKGFGIAG